MTVSASPPVMESKMMRIPTDSMPMTVSPST